MKKIDNNKNKSSLIIHNIEITNYKSNQMRPRSFFRSKSELDNSNPIENSQSSSRFLKYFTCCCSCEKFRKSSDSTSHQMYRTRVFSHEVLKSHDEVEMVDKSIPTDLSINHQEISANSGDFPDVHQNTSEKDPDTFKNDQPQFTSEYIEYHNDSSQDGEVDSDKINCNPDEVDFDSIVRSNSKTSSLIPMTGSDDPESSEINSSINDSEQYEDQADDNNYNQSLDQNNDQDSDDQNQINDCESNQNLNQTPDEKYCVTDDKYKVIYGNLLVLRDVKIHDKLRVSSKGELSIDSSYIPSITRAITGNNKVVTVEQVEETVKTAKKLKYMQTIRDCINDKLIQGIRNLAQTYENTEFKTKLEAMAEDLNSDRE